MRQGASDQITRILRGSRTIAVLGAHPREHKPAHYVPRYLQGAGYALLPVNPTYAGRSLFGQEVAASLRELEVPVDVVLVFRRSEALPEHTHDLLTMTPLPKVVWFQLGIRNDAVAHTLSDAGIEVVQDRCMLVEHQKLPRG